MLTWFGNQKTATKLMAGFAFSGVIMVGLAVLGLTTAMSLSENMANINDAQLKPLMQLAELRGLQHQSRSWVVQAVLTREPADRQQAISKLNEIREKTDEVRKVFEQSIDSPEVKKGYEEFVAAIDAYLQVQDGELLKQALAGNQEEAIATMKGEAGRKYKWVVQAINSLVAIKQKIAQEKYDDSVAMFMTTRTIMSVSCVVGIVAGLLFGWLVARFISRSLADLLTAAQALGGGDLDARSHVTTRDEVGTLAGVFNQMADSMRTTREEQQTMLQQSQEQAMEIKGLTDAIGKSQAMIEFNMDGVVITANENFQRALGYRLDEIKGQHHRLFCEPAYTSSHEYTAFWQKLNRGEFDAGVYKRIGKGGKEIWIQASYNPILDANGKVYKVVKFATDVTVDKSRSADVEGRLKAINKAQAAIEFNLDGTILKANDNFLACVGYSFEEIKGQHHRMFCEPAYASSAEYHAFWQKLNRGDLDAGTYKRIGKGGKEIWLQASYNPIIDANGKVCKVVKYATDITAQKQAQAELEACMAEAQTALGALAEGDLTHVMQGNYQGQLEKIKTSVNGALANLSETITTVRGAVEAVSNGSEEISKGNEDLSQRTSEQASALEETSASMEEMTSTVKQNADNAKQANQLAIAARDTADKGGSVTRKAVDAMGEINKSSKKIADIITVIDEIAFQTNLLALNAAVEAARAGEHGRGFAVVAAEVRNLAQRSATAAKEIKGLINESIQRVNDGSDLVNQSGKTLEEIVSSVKRVTDIIAEITAASQEQASGIDQVNKAVMSMDETTQQNAALVEQTTSAAQSMKEQAKELLQQVSSFNTGQAEAPQRGPAVAKGMSLQARPKTAAKPTVPSGKRVPAPVAAGNGRDQSSSGDEFEEF